MTTAALSIDLLSPASFAHGHRLRAANGTPAEVIVVLTRPIEER